MKKLQVKKTVALFLLIFCALVSGYASSGGNDKSQVRKADRAFRKAKLAEALGYYLKALAINPHDCYANFQAGAIYYLTDSAKMKSMAYFENTIKYAPTQGADTIIDAYYYLGNCYILRKDYDSAIDAFEKYLTHLINDKFDAGIMKEVRHNIDICRHAPELIQRSPDSASYIINGKYQPTYIKNLGSLINTPYPEYAQVVLNNDSTLIFTSRRPASQKGKKEYPTGSYYEDIFISLKDKNGQWMPPSLFSTQLTIKPSKLNLASVCASADGKTLFIFHKGLIYQSQKSATGWSKPERMSEKIKHAKRYTPSVFLSSDGKQLFIVSDKKGGYGGRDIYVSVKDSKGVWSEPQNLGPEINTPYDEDAPFLMPDNKTLFFSSKGHKGLGGYDIFKSVYENGKWSAPVNLGAPVNSPADDIFFTYDTTTQKGYFSSSRINEGYGDMDLYSLSFTCDNIDSTMIKGEITCEGKPVSSSTLVFTDVLSQRATHANTDNMGHYLLSLKPDTKYSITIKVKGYLASTINITTPHQCNVYNLYQLVRLDFKYGNDTTKTHVGQTVTVANAFYRSPKPGYQNISASPMLQAMAKASNDSTDIWLQDTMVSLNYTAEQTDSLNPHAIQVASNKEPNATKPVFRPKCPVVLFKLNSAQIAASYHSSLDSLAKLMKANTKIKLQVIGYTDTTGREKHNLELSKKRAGAIAHYLVKKGVRRGQIISSGKGSNNPVAPNDEEHSYLNRRAELLLIQ